MKYSKFYKTHGHSYEEYEKSHKARLDFLIEDLGLASFVDKKIADIGCGLGFIYNRLPSYIQPNYYGYDGADISNQAFQYQKVDLDNFSIPSKYRFFDVALCFETIEHLTNPYNCLLEIKNILKEDALLYLSIPNIKTEHNTIYPGLLYPVSNFECFLKQMAFEIVDHKIHDKCFYQEVFILKNKQWDQSQMLWRKTEDKFRNIPPHISINL
jgi:2-polyprenyl-3-methyl-5-hydroxy-6-metoxy-1,4-benzoquinol methylase